jgi:Glycosyl hydrolase family 99
VETVYLRSKWNITLVIGVALALLSAPPSLPAHAAAARVVLAYYYTFYDPDAFVVGADSWDGISPYAIAWSGDPVGQFTRWGSAVKSTAPEKLYIPPVSPGCDDAAAGPMTCSRDRSDGQYYQSTWDGALVADPSRAIIVSTFNEWLESAQIEPSAQYGEQYLTLTRKNADTFRAFGD